MRSDALTTEEFIKRAKLKHGDRFNYSQSKYTGYNKKLIIICSLHGEFNQRPNGHLKGQGCCQCGLIAMSDKVKGWTQEEDEFVILNYKKEGAKFCAEKLGLSLSSVFHRARYLKLSSPHKSKNFHPQISGKFWGNIVHGAMAREITLLVSPEEVWECYLKQGKKCALTGWNIYLGKNEEVTASVDRIDSSIREYRKDNIQIVHKDVNQLKMDFPEDYLYEMVKSISSNRKKDFQKYELIWEDDIQNDTIKPISREVSYFDINKSCEA